MGLLGLVNAVEELCGREVAEILHCVWGGIIVVVPTFSMMTEEMRVLQSQIKPRVFGNKKLVDKPKEPSSHRSLATR